MIVTLPTASGIAGKIYWVKNVTTADGRNITVNTTGSETIDGNASITVGPMSTAFGTSYTLASNGTNWFILSQH